MDETGGLIVAGIVLLALLLLTLYACFVVGARDDRKTEEYLRMKKGDWKRANQDPHN